MYLTPLSRSFDRAVRGVTRDSEHQQLDLKVKFTEILVLLVPVPILLLSESGPLAAGATLEDGCFARRP